jgi:hypothetical protein
MRSQRAPPLPSQPRVKPMLAFITSSTTALMDGEDGDGVGEGLITGMGANKNTE